MKRAICYVFAVALCGAVAAQETNGVQDGPEPNAKGGNPKQGLVKLTEDPNPIGELFQMTIDLRPWTAFGRPLFTNPEEPMAMPMVIVPKDYKVRIILPDPEVDNGSCSNRQQTKCTKACGEIRQMSIGCEVNYEWLEDGSCKRTVVCTCASPAQGAQIAGTRVVTTDLVIDDTYE